MNSPNPREERASREDDERSLVEEQAGQERDAEPERNEDRGEPGIEEEGRAHELHA